MASLFLGAIAGAYGRREIHAVTNNLGWREFSSSQIGDAALFKKILAGRYSLLENKKPIYCTAVSPDVEKKIEYNPHDDREGTVHIVVLDENGEIDCSLSAAVDTGEKHAGARIGVPLENAWIENAYPVGDNLNPFIENYLRRNWNVERAVAPWELAELYRHYRLSKATHLAPRIALYTGWYHLAVREARKKNRTETFLWVFDAIPTYFNLYKLAGRGMLRELTLENPSRHSSPSPGMLSKVRRDGKAHYYLGEHKVSRSIPVSIPKQAADHLAFEIKEIPFLDGIIDIHKLEQDFEKGALMLSKGEYEGFSLRDKIALRVSLSLIGKRCFEEDPHRWNPFSRIINWLSLKKLATTQCDFSDIGRLLK